MSTQDSGRISYSLDITFLIESILEFGNEGDNADSERGVDGVLNVITQMIQNRTR